MGLRNIKSVTFDRGGKWFWVDELGDESGEYDTQIEAIAAVTQYVEFLNGHIAGPEQEYKDSIIATVTLAEDDEKVKMYQLRSHPIAQDFYDFSLFMESLPGSIEMTDLQNRFQELKRKTEMHMNYAIRLVG